MSDPKKPKAPRGHHVIEIFDAPDGYHWRLWAPNGRIIATNGEGHARLGYVVERAMWMFENLSVPVTLINSVGVGA